MTKGHTFVLFLQVYPVEKVDVGVVYHRSCFKCRVCGRQLTIQSFQREVDLKSSRIKEVSKQGRFSGSRPHVVLR